jgi:hypothetical protein
VRILKRDGLTLRMIGPREWSNPADRLDVNGDGSVEPLDVLLIIHELNGQRYHDADSRLVDAARLASFPGYFFDANPDGYMHPLDALVIINFMNRLAVSPESESPISVDRQAVRTPFADTSRRRSSTSSLPPPRGEVLSWNGTDVMANVEGTRRDAAPNVRGSADPRPHGESTRWVELTPDDSDRLEAVLDVIAGAIADQALSSS